VAKDAPEGSAHHTDDLAGSLGLLCIWGANLGETFGEDSPLATGVPATPATQMQPEDHLRALDRKVFERTPIPAMARARDRLATRTDSRVLTVSFHNPTLVRLEYVATRCVGATMPPLTTECRKRGHGPYLHRDRAIRTTRPTGRLVWVDNVCAREWISGLG
jgi:hypothetical protein